MPCGVLVGYRAEQGLLVDELAGFRRGCVLDGAVLIVPVFDAGATAGCGRLGRWKKGWVEICTTPGAALLHV